MKKLIYSLSISFLFLSCQQQEKADLIVINANAYTVNNNFDKAESFAIKDGKFIAVGSNAEIQSNYATLKTIDAKNQTIVPGLIISSDWV
jgi:predicted amidohydrolase YtcJ